jgi:SagB-type dehydrogenase family enzyme
LFQDFFEYHQKTKHSYYSVRSNPNRIDWDNPPSRFKPYPKEVKKVVLDLDKENHRFIYQTAGVTAKKSYPGVEYYLRVNPSAGALYPNEIYFQSRNNSDIDDGIYHYDSASNSIELLTSIGDDGLEPYFGYENKQNGFIFLVSSVYFRSSWKYKNRAYRYCLLDAGHILGALEASAYSFSKSYEIRYDFDKESLNEIFGFKSDEFFTSAFTMVFPANKDVRPLDIKFDYVNPTGDFVQNQLVEEAYKDSLIIKNKSPQLLAPSFNYNKEVFQEVILNRRSIREFSQGSMSKIEFDMILKNIKDNITSDCDEEVEIYYVINRVKDMILGLYKDDVLLKEGDLKEKAGYLCLEQDLGKSSAVTFFLTTTSKNYQASYQKAGIIGHRLYLAANYLGYGCSGIGAYYDDEVCEFIAKNTMVLYALAIGK